MVFAYLRDFLNYYFGNRYPNSNEVATIDKKKSTALVPYATKVFRPSILRECWVETHPSKSVCISRLHQIHEEF